MERFTKILGFNEFCLTDETKIAHDVNGYSGEAVDRLAKFENMCEELFSSQSKISAELEKLRNDGKTHSVQFKELMAKKLINTSIISFFKSHGFE